MKFKEENEKLIFELKTAKIHIAELEELTAYREFNLKH